MLEQENDLSLASGFDRSSKNKDLCESNSALDSGFLSGPQDIFSGEIDGEKNDHSHKMHTKSTKTQEETFEDSGLVMISTGGTESCLSNRFDNLEINNLGGTKVKSSQKEPPQQPPLANLWEVCYRQDNDGDTQLHLAIINEIPKFIWAIISLAPAPWLLDLKNDDAQAPIHLAALTKQSNVIRRLLVCGAKASLRDGDGNTALHLACINDDSSSVEALLTPISTVELKEYQQITKQSNASNKFSIDLDQRNFDGENCVHIAAMRNQIQILDTLITRGADINAREGRAGYTPLHIAVENKDLGLATFLLNQNHKGLDTETLNYRQITAYQLACELENPEMIDLLKSRGCEVRSPPESDYDDFDESDDFDSDMN